MVGLRLQPLPRLNGWVLRHMGFRLVRIRPTRRQVALSPTSPRATPIEEMDLIRFRTTDWVASVPVADLVGRPIFGYGPQSWHPLVAASHELLTDRNSPYESSVLRRFYDSFTPKTIAEACHLSDPGPLADIPARNLFEPWQLDSPPFDDPHTAESAGGSPLFGPVSRRAGEAEWRRLQNRIKSILRYGYRPEHFPEGRIRIVVLRYGGQQRYLVAHGQHRAAILAALGHTRIDVSLQTYAPPVVDESEAHLWPHVRSGFLTQERALSMLRRYFTTPASDPALPIGAAARDESDSQTAVRLTFRTGAR